MRAAVVPILFVVLVGAVIGGLILLRGSPEPEPPVSDPQPDPDTGLPATLAGEHGARILELKKRIQDALGAEAEAFATLSATMPEDAAARVEWLRFLKSEFLLGVRGEDAEAGVAALSAVRGALGETGDPARPFVSGPAFRDVWILALSSPFPATRVEAIRLLAELAGDIHRARIASCLGDVDPRVRTAAIHAYAALGGSPARLVTRYRIEEDTHVRHALLLAFATDRRMRIPEVLAIEAEAVRSGTNVQRIQAMQNLAAWRDQDLLEGVLDNLGSRERTVRKSALLTLERLRDRRCLERLRAHAEKESDEELAEQARRVISGLE